MLGFFFFIQTVCNNANFRPQTSEESSLDLNVVDTWNL